LTKSVIVVTGVELELTLFSDSPTMTHFRRSLKGCAESTLSMFALDRLISWQWQSLEQCTAGVVMKLASWATTAAQQWTSLPSRQELALRQSPQAALLLYIVVHCRFVCRILLY